jgi:hypothetical protein
MVYYDNDIFAGAFDQPSWSEYDLFYSMTICEAQHHDISLPGELCRRRKGFALSRLRGFQRLRFLHGTVPHGNLPSAIEQTLRHQQAHFPETTKSNAW